MGCDIHALMERRGSFGWVDAGEPDLGRNYDLFAILAGVRNRDDIPPISEPRGLPGHGWPEEDGGLRFAGGDPNDRPSAQFLAYVRDWEADGHSHSWVTLEELKGYDLDREITDNAYVQRDDDGGVAYTYRGGSGVTATTERVGPRKIGDWADGTPGVRRTVGALIEHMERVGAERLVFFFDN